MNKLIKFFLFSFLFTGQAMAAPEKKIYGYIEKVTLLTNKLDLPAKLDTGAKSASLHATNITEIDVKGVPYLRFTVPYKHNQSVFECEYIGKVKIKARLGDAVDYTPYIKRPIVLMYMQLGDKVRAIQVNLTNRKRFLYPLLLGRDAIKDFDGVIDPSKIYTLKSHRSGKRHEK
jgi:hypothetical protein